uniref:EamA domain-containing protein n=1 Tax=Tetraselmis sp. GSL018 TaxID=582737 RepID=A0A061SE46_9CHLO
MKYCYPLQTTYELRYFGPVSLQSFQRISWFSCRLPGNSQRSVRAKIPASSTDFAQCAGVVDIQERISPSIPSICFAELLLVAGCIVGPANSSDLVSSDWLQNLPSCSTICSAQLRNFSGESWLKGILVKSVSIPRVRGVIMLNLLVFLYATNWSIVKTGGEKLDPCTFAALRFSTAALPFLFWLPKALQDNQVLTTGVEIGMWSFLGYQTQAVSLAETTASKAAFLSTFTVLAVPLVASLDGRTIRIRTVLAAVGAFVGVSLLEEGAPNGFCCGDMWAFVSACLFGVQIYRTEVHARRLPSSSSMALMSCSLVALAAMSVAAAAVAHPPSASPTEILRQGKALVSGGLHLPLMQLAR